MSNLCFANRPFSARERLRRLKLWPFKELACAFYGFSVVARFERNDTAPSVYLLAEPINLAAKINPANLAFEQTCIFST